MDKCVGATNPDHPEWAITVVLAEDWSIHHHRTIVGYIVNQKFAASLRNCRPEGFFFLRLAPSSPSANRKLLSATRNIRTGSVDLPDEMEKSLSSASTSPCPSPVRQIQVLCFCIFFIRISQNLKSYLQCSQCSVLVMLQWFSIWFNYSGNFFFSFFVKKKVLWINSVAIYFIYNRGNRKLVYCTVKHTSSFYDLFSLLFAAKIATKINVFFLLFEKKKL